MATYSYASVEDYETRTGVDVPTEQEIMVQTRLDDASNLIAVHLGAAEQCVVEMFPEILTMLTVSTVYRLSSVPAGVRSKSVGATSVSYTDDAAQLQLLPSEQDLLDSLITAACPPNPDPTYVPGLGCVGVTWGGYSNPAEHWARDVDVWVT
jgi:hypothetical protein